MFTDGNNGRIFYVSLGTETVKIDLKAEMQRGHVVLTPAGGPATRKQKEGN